MTDDENEADNKTMRERLTEAASAENTGGVSVREFEENPDAYPEINATIKNLRQKETRLSTAQRLAKEAGVLKGLARSPVHHVFHSKILEMSEEVTRKYGLTIDTLNGENFSQAVEELRPLLADYFSEPFPRFDRLISLLANLSDEEPGSVFYHYVDEATDEADLDNNYRDRFARLLFDAVERFWGYYEEVDPMTDASYFMPGEYDGMFYFDAAAIDWLEAEGWTEWETDADGARKMARNRWENKRGTAELLELWVDPDEPIPWKLQPVELICKHLWETELREQWERSRDSFPAVTRGVYDSMERVSFRPQRNIETKRELRQLVLFNDGDLVASTSTLPLESYERLESIISEGTKDLRTMTAIRFMTRLIRQCHQQWVEGDQNPTIFQWEGWTDLAEWAGATSNKARERLPKILEAGARWEVKWKKGAAIGLWTATVTRGEAGAKGGRIPDNIQVRVGEPLAPLWTFQGGNRSVLMPVVELPELDTRATRWMPGQAAFSLAVVRELVERRDEIYQHGGAELTPTTVKRIAARVGCPKTTATRLMQRWVDPSRDVPLFLDAVEAGRYHLADNEKYGKARRFLDETAKRSHRGKTMGKASARKRKGKPKKT